MKTIRITTIILLLLVAANALIAGYLFITDPSGASMGLDTSRLRYSPFADYTVPGIVLFVVNGIFNLIAAIFTLMRWKHYPAMVTFQGVALAGWILVQVILLREVVFLHYFLGLSGLLLFLFGNRLNVGHE